MAKAQNESKSYTVRKNSRSKSTSKNTKSAKKSKIQVLKKEIAGIFIVAFAIFLIVITTKESQTGILGKSISVFILSLFGKGAYILPYAILTAGVMKLLNLVVFDDNNQITAIAVFFICYVMYCSLTDAFVYDMFVKNIPFSEMLNKSIEFGTNNVGGGLLGNALTFICVKLVGKNGTLIILFTMIFIAIVLITNQSIIGGANIIINSIRKIFRVIYNFIFAETQDDEEYEDEEEITSGRKNGKKENTKESIKVFDYTDEQIKDKKNLNSKITQLKFDDRSSENIKKQERTEIPEPIIKGMPTEENKTEKLADTVDKTVKIDKTEKVDKIEKSENKQKKFEHMEVTDDIINIAGNHPENDVMKYKIPSISLLDASPKQNVNDKEELRKDAEKLIETLSSFNIQCNIVQINKGPTITRYELQPAPGIKVSRITGLTNDLAMSLATSSIRMEAPIPGKSAIGIEVPNKVKTDVFLKNLIESKEYKSNTSKVPFALGKDIAGEDIVASIDKMPHLLVAGATGSGKSVCINSLIMSILYRAKPDEVKLILIDPKVVELSVYNGIPHLLIPVVTDPRKASNALNWAVSEMTNRYKIFAQNSVRDIASYNIKMVKEDLGDKMPLIIIIIDELADLMAVSSSEVEESITRIAQLARACGIHLVIATQRPSVDVITGVIKANIPSRIAFAVSSYIDSRTILDSNGAEKLLGKGDMLYHPMGMSKPIRIQGTFISDDEIKRVVDNIIAQKIDIYTNKVNEEIEKTPNPDEKVDDFLEKAITLVVEDGQASASYLQRKLKVGYSRGARIMDQLEERGIIGGPDGSKPRKVLITKEELEEMRGSQ